MRFDHALVRRPAASVVRGLRAVDHGSPTFEGVKAEQDAYVAALQTAGVAVDLLPALDEFPDSVFVEDPALVFPEGAIVLRPGAPSRMGEAAAIAPELHRRFERVLDLKEGFAEGGDILTTPSEVLIGLSARTNLAGASAVLLLLKQLGRNGRIVTTPPGVLHFKTDCSLLDEETILSTRRLADSGVFAGYNVILTPEGEEAAADGYNVVPLENTQIARLDAGFSCLSLRWRRSG